MHNGKEDTLGWPALAFLLKNLFNQFGLMNEIVHLLIDMPAAGPVAGAVPAKGANEVV